MIAVFGRLCVPRVRNEPNIHFKMSFASNWGSMTSIIFFLYTFISYHIVKLKFLTCSPDKTVGLDPAYFTFYFFQICFIIPRFDIQYNQGFRNQCWFWTQMLVKYVCLKLLEQHNKISNVKLLFAFFSWYALSRSSLILAASISSSSSSDPNRSISSSSSSSSDWKKRSSFLRSNIFH